jgi:hypothetical protein
VSDAPPPDDPLDVTADRPSDLDAPADHPADLDAPAVPFLNRRHRPRRGAESAAVRLVATCGIVGISVAIAAILGTQDVSAWIIGLVVSVTSVVLAALLWSSRTL